MNRLLLRSSSCPFLYTWIAYATVPEARRQGFAVGFEVEDKWEVDGKVLGAMLKAGDARLGLSQDDGKKGKDRVKGVGIRIYIEASNDIDQVAAHAKASGIPLTKEPHDTEWGSRAFEVTEPSGFLLTIASRSQS